MPTIQYTAQLDFTDNGTFETGWRIKQGDFGDCEIVFRVVNNGVNMYDASVTPEIVFRRADGASVISNMTPNDGTYKYAFVGNELAVPGLTLVDVKYTDSEGRISTASCRFTVVEDTIGYDPTGAHTYDNPVSELVETATAAAETAIDSSFKAEGYAVGEQGGEPVGPESPYYENNAKYYAEYAADFIKAGTKVKTNTTGQFETSTGGILQSCVINLEPVQSGSGTPSPDNVRPITGHSEVDIKNVGKNKLPMTVEDIKSANTSGTWSGNVYTKNGVTFTLVTNNYGKITSIVTNGTASGNADLNLMLSTKFEVGTYSFNGCPSNGGESKYSMLIGDGYSRVASDYGTGSNFTISTAKNIQALIRVANATQVNNLVFYPMIRVSSDTDSNFAPYLGYTKTISLGQTVYGGSVDVVSGVLTITRKNVKGSTLTWLKHSYSGNNVYYSYSVNSEIKTPPNTSTIIGVLSSSYTDISWDACFQPNAIGMGVANNGTFCIADPNEATLTDFQTDVANVDICYELATPITIQLTPQQLETLIGQNTVSVPLDGQSLDSLTYREVLAWDDVERAVSVKLDLSSVAPIEYTDKASQSYNQKQLFIKDNKLCQALASISSGASFTENTNFKYTTLAEIIEPLIP